MAKVAVLQMVSSAKVQDNLLLAEQLIVQAYEQGAQLVLLPENFAFMGKQDKDKQQMAEIYGEGPIQAKISQLSKHLKLWIIAGTLPLKTTGHKLRSSCLVYDERGQCAARYDKIHLFDVRISEQEYYEESATVEPGKELVVVNTPVGKVGLAICYDLRFPELFRHLALRGAQIITVPSAFTAMTGLAHWEVLLRARAIENLCYVLAANQGGAHENGRNTYGHSMIVEPWGAVLGEQNQGSGLVQANIDIKALEQRRKTFPCVDHHVLN